MRVFVLMLMVAVGSGCSMRRLAVNKLGDAIASGGSTYESDDDVELVGGALPFSLKLIESMLAESPRHRGLLAAACKGFATYGYVYVQQPAEMASPDDLDLLAKARARARRLYLRANEYGMNSLDTYYPGLKLTLTATPATALSVVKRKADVPDLYWTAVSLGLAISVSKNDASLLARVPEVEALIRRAMELDEAWDKGALHEFSITFAGSRPGQPDFAAIGRHYQRALELSADTRPGIHVAYAEAALIPKQDSKEFRMMLEKALGFDANKSPQNRLVNTLALRRAQWLLSRTAELILEATPEQSEKEEP